MLSLEQLTDYINALRDNHKTINGLYALGLDLINFCDAFRQPANILEAALLNKEQRSELDWWLYDSPNGIEGTPKASKYTEITYPDGKVAKLHTINLLHQYLLTLEEKPNNEPKSIEGTQKQPE